MTTYDYYKGQTTHQLNYNAKLWVESKDGQTTVQIIIDGNHSPYPCYQINKGVWAVKDGSIGERVYIPEGDPNYDKDADQMVWGRFVKSALVEALEQIKEERDDEYDELTFDLRTAYKEGDIDEEEYDEKIAKINEELDQKNDEKIAEARKNFAK